MKHSKNSSEEIQSLALIWPGLQVYLLHYPYRQFFSGDFDHKHIDCRKYNFEKGVASRAIATPIIILSKNSSVSQEYMHLAWDWGRVRVWVSNWFKQIFPIFITWLPCNVN
jgi:hypothetical protein